MPNKQFLQIFILLFLVLENILVWLHSMFFPPLLSFYICFYTGIFWFNSFILPRSFELLVSVLVVPPRTHPSPTLQKSRSLLWGSVGQLAAVA